MSESDNESDQTIVINDLLSFSWCKLKNYSRLIVKNSIEEFYSNEDVAEALKTLLTALNPEYVEKMKSTLMKKTLAESVLSFMVDSSNNNELSLPIFVCKNINNVPKIKGKENKIDDSKKKSKPDFMKEHEKLKSELQEVFDSLYELKKQYESITGQNIDISEFEIKAEKYGVLKKKPLVKDLNYLQTLIDQEEKDEIMEEVSSAEMSETEDDIVQQRINLIANRRQRASLRQAKKQQMVEEIGIKEEILSSERSKVINIDKDGSMDSKSRYIIVDKLFDDSKKISTSIYRCSYCLYRSTDKNSAKTHVCDTQIKTSLKSKRKTALSRFLIVEHHFDETLGAYTLYKCSKCGFCSNHEETTAQHSCIKVSYEKPLNGNFKGRVGWRQKSYDCHSCGASFKMRKDLQKHIETHLGGGHRCPLCGSRFSIEVWLDHVRSCPGDGSTSIEDHYCEVCDVFYADKRTLSFHRAFHDPSRPFQCVECKYRFYTQKTVEDHYRTHALHRDSRKCPFCDFRAIKAVKIVDHIRCHTGDRPYKCPQCERSCTTFNALKVHLTSHAPERDFACDICGKKFKSQNKVASHRKIHNMERPHKCPICGKGFKFGLQMALHHRMHLDIRKHACPICPYKARTAAVLRGHMNTHTKSRPYKCTQCDFGANHKSYLNWHIRCYHPKPEQIAANAL